MAKLPIRVAGTKFNGALGGSDLEPMRVAEAVPDLGLTKHGKLDDTSYKHPRRPRAPGRSLPLLVPLWGGSGAGPGRGVKSRV